MLKQSIPEYPLRLYLLPKPNDHYAECLAYCPNEITRLFYKVYSKEIDRSYTLKRYESRYDQPPHKEISSIYGKEAGLLFNVLNTPLKGILIKSVLTGTPIPDLIRDYQIQYYKLTLIDHIVPFPEIYIPGERLTPSKQTYLSLMCGVKDHPYIPKNLVKQLKSTLQNENEIHLEAGSFYRHWCNMLVRRFTRSSKWVFTVENEPRPFHFW